MQLEAAIQKELDLITNAVKANTNPLSIYLFGSYAKGIPNADSDLDVYVVVPDTEGNLIDLHAKIRIDLAKKRKICYPLDLLIGKESTFENRKNRLTLEKIIATEGMKIYG